MYFWTGDDKTVFTVSKACKASHLYENSLPSLVSKSLGNGNDNDSHIPFHQVGDRSVVKHNVNCNK